VSGDVANLGATFVNVTFLFWNIRGNHAKSVAARTPRLLRSLQRFSDDGVDVFLLAECGIDRDEIVSALGTKDGRWFQQVEANSRRVAVFSGLKDATWTERFYDAVSDRITVHEAQIGTAPGILLIGAHLASPQLSLAGRAENSRKLAMDIRKIEEDAGHTRTVLVGDLNMNPFDAGLVDTSALHAVMTKRLAASVQDLDARKESLPFYNPMWSYFGDWSPALRAEGNPPDRVPGTYFFGDTNDRASHFWQVYDQVLLRPQLMDRLVRLDVAGTDGLEPLTSKKSGRPRKASLSDHLPLVFTIELG
jgi:endonuclease/exonuclease/phosphatase family metal-dependent hydrolase